MKIYLSTSPTDKIPELNPIFDHAHIAYNIRSNHLMRGRLFSNTKSGMMVITNIDTTPSEGSFDVLSTEIYNECLRRNFTGVVLDFPPKPTTLTAGFASNLCQALHNKKILTYIPYLYSVFCPDSNYIVSSAISGGSLREHLQQLIDIHGRTRLALEIERITMDFNMPSSSPEGKSLSQNELSTLMEKSQSQSFYSSELLGNYFTYTDTLGNTHFVLYDNAQSILDKLHLAESLGFETAFLLYPDISDIFYKLQKHIQPQK